MVQMGLVSLEKQFVDGIKIAANASKYSFVWILGNKHSLRGKKLSRMPIEGNVS